MMPTYTYLEHYQKKSIKNLFLLYKLLKSRLQILNHNSFFLQAKATKNGKKKQKQVNSW